MSSQPAASPARIAALPHSPNAQLARTLTAQLTRGEDLTREEARLLLAALLDDNVTDTQIAAALTALACKGETADELAGMADAMRERMVRVRIPADAAAIDTCGTGASKAKTFNVSTAAAFVIAACGLTVAKHGARASTSNTGSADVLNALGVKLQSRDESERSLAEHGLCFMFAPLHHPASARVAPIRRELGFRTVFNLIGPLSNPASTPFHLMGVGAAELQSKMADALANLGTTHSWVVHSEDGMDELSIAAPTRVAEVKNGEVKNFTIAPQDFGLMAATCAHVRCADAAESAAIALDVLRGKAERAATDLVILNAAAALHLGLGLDPRTAAERAAQAVDSGAALHKLEAMRSGTVEVAR